MSANPLEPNQHMHIVNEEIEAVLRDIAAGISTTLPEGWGFLLEIFSFGPDGAAFYVSNAQREDIIKLLRELADKLESGKL